MADAGNTDGLSKVYAGGASLDETPSDTNLAAQWAWLRGQTGYAGINAQDGVSSGAAAQPTSGAAPNYVDGMDVRSGDSATSFTIVPGGPGSVSNDGPSGSGSTLVGGFVVEPVVAPAGLAGSMTASGGIGQTSTTGGNNNNSAPTTSTPSPVANDRPAGTEGITVATPSNDASGQVTDVSPKAATTTSNIWVSEGAAPGIDGQETVSPNNQVNGAIQAIAVDPTDANVMYVGSVNGGVWKTTNATATSPHWVPLTDSLPSLSIGALVFDPTDATNQTLIAGIGSTSSYFLNDQFTGVLRSTDGGATWSQLGTTALAGENIISVAGRGATLLAAADNAWGGGLGEGLFRSTDTGATWTLISDGKHGLPNLTSVSDIVGDPLHSNVLYAAVTGANGGVFKSTDTGQTWTSISTGIGDISSATDKIKLAVHDDGTNLAVFATVDNNQSLSGVFRSLNGGNFTALDVPSGGTQGTVHGAIAADPNNPNIAYIGYGGGASNYLTRIDASKPSGSQITDISGGNFGSPHVDIRSMQIDANGNLIMSSDGGLFRLPTPTTNNGSWSAVDGDISVFEFHNIAYDHVSHVIMGGAQDNGTLVQQSPGSTTWEHILGGDGGDVVIDNVSLASKGESVRYSSAQFLEAWQRQVYDSSNKLISTTSLASISDGTFTTPVALNNVDPTRLLVGGSGHIYESKDQGSTLNTIANSGVNGIGFDGGDEMVYGGYKGAVADADLVYAASGQNVLEQSSSGGGFTTLSPGASSDIRGVTDDPINWGDVFAIDQNQIFESTDAGSTWVNVTGNLTSVSAPDLRSITYVHGKYDDALVVGTSSGVFDAKVSQLGGASAWGKVGSNLPDVITYDLAYDSTDNVLVAGTMGRGAWLVNDATGNLGLDTPPPATLTFALGTFTTNAGGWTSQDTYPRVLGDVNGDGLDDIIGFGSNGVYVSLATGSGKFASPIFATSGFGTSSGGWSSQDIYPREVADVNGDGKADIVGFGSNGAYVALGKGDGTFGNAFLATGGFGTDNGWASQNTYPRELADVNGDGKADIVGFGADGAYVALGKGDGTFGNTFKASAGFGTDNGWTSQDTYPRELADVNGDGKADIVGFGGDGVYVALGNGDGTFGNTFKASSAFGQNNGWSSNDIYPRELADVNGDGRADLVAFASNGVYTALGNTDGTFATPVFDFSSLGASAAAGGWTSQNTYPRLLGDVTGDKKADVVAFASDGVYIADAAINFAHTS